MWFMWFVWLKLGTHSLHWYIAITHQQDISIIMQDMTTMELHNNNVEGAIHNAIPYLHLLLTLLQSLWFVSE